MIRITTQFRGCTTVASCWVKKDGKRKRLSVEKPTGAKAVNVLVGRLARMRLGGEAYCLVGEGGTRGVVPAWPYRRRGGCRDAQMSLFGDSQTYGLRR